MEVNRFLKPIQFIRNLIRPYICSITTNITINASNDKKSKPFSAQIEQEK